MSTKTLKRDSFMSQFLKAKSEVQKLRKLYPHCLPKQKKGSA